MFNDDNDGTQNDDDPCPLDPLDGCLCPGPIIPNGFNSDAENFVISTNGHLVETFTIYNRFGVIQFQTSSPDTVSWDGKDLSGSPVNAGIYPWQMRFGGGDLCFDDGQAISGNLTVTRLP